MPAAAIVGGSVVGGLISANAPGKAANAQAGAASAANGLSQDQYNQTRADQRPFQQTGVAGNNLLSAYLGIGAQNKTYDQLMAELGPNYFDYGTTSGKKYNHPELAIPEINRILNEQKTQAAQVEQMKQDGTFGSLLRNFGQSDLDNDVIYQNTFQNALDSGTKGVNQQASATGSLLSGNTLKALTRFGANTTATYGNDSYNRFNTNQNNTYNRLAGISGAGQNANAQVQSAGQNYSNSVGNNLIGAANARGASAIAGANSFNSTLSQGANAYQQQNLINSLGSSGYGYNTNGAYSGQF